MTTISSSELASAYFLIRAKTCFMGQWKKRHFELSSADAVFCVNQRLHPQTVVIQRFYINATTSASIKTYRSRTVIELRNTPTTPVNECVRWLMRPIDTNNCRIWLNVIRDVVQKLQTIEIQIQINRNYQIVPSISNSRQSSTNNLNRESSVQMIPMVDGPSFAKRTTQHVCFHSNSQSSRHQNKSILFNQQNSTTQESELLPSTSSSQETGLPTTTSTSTTIRQDHCVQHSPEMNANILSLSRTSKSPEKVYNPENAVLCISDTILQMNSLLYSIEKQLQESEIKTSISLIKSLKSDNTSPTQLSSSPCYPPPSSKKSLEASQNLLTGSNTEYDDLLQFSQSNDAHNNDKSSSNQTHSLSSSIVPLNDSSLHIDSSFTSSIKLNGLHAQNSNRSRYLAPAYTPRHSTDYRTRLSRLSLISDSPTTITHTHSLHTNQRHSPLMRQISPSSRADCAQSWNDKFQEYTDEDSKFDSIRASTMVSPRMSTLFNGLPESVNRSFSQFSDTRLSDHSPLGLAVTHSEQGQRYIPSSRLSYASSISDMREWVEDIPSRGHSLHSNNNERSPLAITKSQTLRKVVAHRNACQRLLDNGVGSALSSSPEPANYHLNTFHHSSFSLPSLYPSQRDQHLKMKRIYPISEIPSCHPNTIHHPLNCYYAHNDVHSYASGSDSDTESDGTGEVTYEFLLDSY